MATVVETTAEERDRIRRLAHVIYSDAYNDVDHMPELDWMDIHVNQVTTNRTKVAHWGSSQWHTDHEYNLGIDFRHWRDNPVETKMVILMHEVAHARFSGHDSDFFNKAIDILDASQRSERLRNYIEEPFYWRTMDWVLFADVYTNLSKIPMDDAFDHFKDKILGIDRSWMDLRNVANAQSRTGTGDLVAINDLTFERMHPEDVLAEVDASVSMEDPYPPNVRTDGNGTVTGRDWLVNLAIMTGKRHVRV